MKKVIPILICFAFIGLTTGCSKSNSGYSNTPPPPPPGGSGNNISMYNMLYSPASKTVAKGAVVKWTNDDGFAHTVSSDDGKTFDSGNIAGGSSYSYTADSVGTFKYHCKIHGTAMSGTLVVTP